jgi:hypothetical protein
MRASTHLLTAAAAGADRDQSAQIAGLLAAMTLPALFWTALIAGGASLAGIAVTASALVLTGTAIAAFLGAVCAPIMLRA